jgi:hypothetical protein
LIIRILFSSANTFLNMTNKDRYGFASNNIASIIKNLSDGLDPEILAYWYKRVEDKAIENVPSNLKDKVHFKQDRILWMKFEIDLSKRALPQVMKAIEEYIVMMPYSTALYFRKIQQILIEEMNKDLR